MTDEVLWTNDTGETVIVVVAERRFGSIEVMKLSDWLEKGQEGPRIKIKTPGLLRFQEERRVVGTELDPGESL